MRPRKHDCGQATVITVLFLTVLLAMTAAVLDVGSWFRADRALQSTVDAAALAGAQELPKNPATALLSALNYANKNGGGVAATDISFESKYVTADTIKVKGERPAPGFFSKILGIDSIKVAASAKARSAGVSKAMYAAPIVVDEKHPGLQCPDANGDGHPDACQGVPQTLTYLHFKQNGQPDGAGNFGFINLSGDNGVGASDLSEWILHGFSKYMSLGNYTTKTGNEFTSTQVEDSLKARYGDVLLFPVYRKIIGTGTNAKFEIVGWVGFRVTRVDFQGTSQTIKGFFTDVIWTGVQLEPGGPAPRDFGVRAVQLVE
jgi:predicted outer membrane repeat protein